MFNYVKGILASKAPTQSVVEVGSLGYEITIPLSTFDALPSEGQPVKLLTHFHVREDVQKLFGFFTRAERDLFRLLLSISGIGPRMAITILSGMSVKAFKQAIVESDINLLNSISGIGRKTAERIVLELREKVGLESALTKDGSPGVGDEVILGDAVNALVSLGYKHNTARQAIQKTLRGAKDITTEGLVREALKVV